MQITKERWTRYIKALEQLEEGAAKELEKVFKPEKYLEQYGAFDRDDIENMINYLYQVSTKYGEGAAELACRMYDAQAKAQGVHVPPAEPAPTATYPEVARAVRGSLLDSKRGATLRGAVKRLVKQTSVDTTFQNALRDGAEFAWVPQGDTCAFCIMLASNGWQKASRKAIRKGHASHVHANCNCTYAVRFDGKSTIEGYDPDEYADMYYSSTDEYQWRDRVNAMRLELYKDDKDRINEQKREAYAKRNNVELG